MAKVIRGKDILDALAEFREPVTLKTIVKYVSEEYSKPPEQVKKLVEEALNGGVRYGYVQKHNEYYYRLCDAIDAMGAIDGVDEIESSEEDDEVDSVGSNESILSDEHDVVPEKKPAKKNTAEVPKKLPQRTISRKPSQVRKLSKREREKRERELARLLDDQEEDDEVDYSRYEKHGDKTPRTQSETNSMKRRRPPVPSNVQRGKGRGRSRSTQRR